MTRPIRMANLTLLGALLIIGTSCASIYGDHVQSTARRGPYLDSTLLLSGRDWRFLTPISEDCNRVLTPKEKVTRTRRGAFGRLTSPSGTVCDPVGVGTLDRWRRGRREGEMQPRSPASWRIIHEDDEVMLLRGRFMVANRLGLANSGDSIAMVANDETCAPIARSGSSILTFRQTGSRVLNLGPCPVVGIARPIGGRHQ